MIQVFNKSPPRFLQHSAFEFTTLLLCFYGYSVPPSYFKSGPIPTVEHHGAIKTSKEFIVETHLIFCSFGLLHFVL